MISQEGRDLLCFVQALLCCRCCGSIGNHGLHIGHLPSHKTIMGRSSSDDDSGGVNVSQRCCFQRAALRMMYSIV
jgi:hypothetical protein